jgi:ribosomal protein S18 acetylase RimI-like enzyme
VTILIRSALPTETEAVLRLWAAADAEPSHTDDARSVRRLIEHDSSALLVAEDDGEIVGSIIAGFDGWRGSIYRLVVAPAHRRSGVGQRLLRSAESRLTAKGAVRLQAIVVESSPMATGFWRSSGWEEQTQRIRFVKG